MFRPPGPPPPSWRPWAVGALAALTLSAAAAVAPSPETGLLFHLSAAQGTTADFSAAGTTAPNFDAEVTVIPDGARGPGLRCGNLQRLSWWAPGNIYAQRGTLAFFWRARDPVGPTEFPVFRVAFADHSSWDMVWLRIDYNGHGFDAFVTDTGLARVRVSATVQPFPQPEAWTHLTLAWDETQGIRFYVNGKLAAAREQRALLDAGLDQFGPHSRIISPWQVQSDYNFVRGGDVDEIRIYDRPLSDDAIAALARGDAVTGLPPLPPRDLADDRARAEWWWRYGWNRPDDPPPTLPAAATTVRKVEIHDAYDLKRWWWKACDGIRETTWPGVYNRSRLPGRSDYFHLPDWDCYVLSGQSITFHLPDEPWNHLEIAGAAWGRMVAPGVGPGDTAAGSILFERPPGQEKTVHRFAAPRVGGKIRFDNAEQEEPIEELAAYWVTAGSEPAGSVKLRYTLQATPPDDPCLGSLVAFIRGRHPADEQAMLVARPADRLPASSGVVAARPGLPLVHVLIPCDSGDVAHALDKVDGGLDGIAIDLPALRVQPTHGSLFPLNLRVKDPLWPMRDMLDFTFSVKPGEAHTLWLDLRDRLLPPGRSLYLTIAGAGGDFNAASLAGAEIRLVFKPRAAARAEHELDRFTQARDAYAMLVEEHPHSPQYNLWNRFEGDLKDLLRVNPDHVLGRQYAAAAFPGWPRPPFTQPEPPAGVPLWAFRQVELLARVQRFVDYYIDHRQIAYGDLGGGLSDDTDLTNTWPGVALMGCEPDKIAGSLRRVLDACYANGMFTRGLPTIQTDELHSYEEGINCLGQNLILNPGSPRQLERAMETTRGVIGLTAINPAGHRHIRSSYYSGTRVAEDGVWGWAKAYSYLVLQPAQLLVDYNGNPTAKQILLELADGLLAHRHADATGRMGIPSAIEFATDREASATRAYFPWPVFWTAWQWTGQHKYLDPILDGGTTTLTSVNADALDLLGLRGEWGPRILGGQRGRAPDGRPGAQANNYRASTGGQFAWQLTGDKHHLEQLYAAQIEETALLEYINTEGSLWIDRVGVPHADLQRARLGGVALVRNAPFPGHLVSWRFDAPAGARSVALLIPEATPTAFKVIAYNLETAPVTAVMIGAHVDPGVWEITQGVDSNGDDVADGATARRTARFERGRALDFVLPARATTILTLRLQTPGTPYWQRPDLGLDPADVSVNGRTVRVRVHSLGAAAAPETKIALKTFDGSIVASAMIPALPAPLDLLPKTAEVVLPLPRGIQVAGGFVEIDPDGRLEEITLSNNRAPLPEAVFVDTRAQRLPNRPSR